MQKNASLSLSKLIFSALTGAFMVLAFFSCAQNSAGISAIDAAVIFDYADETSLPSVTLSVFVQPTYDAERVASVSIEHLESGYTWTQNTPQIIPARNAKSWAGYRNFCPVQDQELPIGKYECRCTDAASETASAAFVVTYPQELLSLSQSQAETFLKSTAVTRFTALYDSDGVLIYFGDEDFDISKYATARTKRTVLSCYEGTLQCMLSRENLH